MFAFTHLKLAITHKGEGTSRGFAPVLCCSSADVLAQSDLAYQYFVFHRPLTLSRIPDLVPHPAQERELSARLRICGNVCQYSDGVLRRTALRGWFRISDAALRRTARAACSQPARPCSLPGATALARCPRSAPELALEADMVCVCVRACMYVCVCVRACVSIRARARRLAPRVGVCVGHGRGAEQHLDRAAAPAQLLERLHLLAACCQQHTQPDCTS